MALHYACGGFLPEVIRRLARIPGIDVNAVNGEGISPLMLLLCSTSLPSDTQEIVSLLEAVPFDYSLKDKHGRNMFCYAAMSQVGVIQFEIEYNVLLFSYVFFSHNPMPAGLRSAELFDPQGSESSGC